MISISRKYTLLPLRVSPVRTGVTFITPYQTTLLYGDLMAKLNKSWGDFSLNAAIGTSITDTRTSALRLDSKTASLYYPNVFTIANIKHVVQCLHRGVG